MLKILKKPMLKLLIGAMCISLMPARIVFAADMATNNTQTTGTESSVNGVNTTTGAAVNVNVTTGPGANVNYGDTTAPVFKSISIDKKSATTGDTLTVTVEASDDMSGIKYISVDYKAPVGSASKSASLRKISEGKYSGTLTVGPNDTVGVWKVDFISLTDNASNSIYINNSEINKYGSVLKELSAGDFEVSGTTPDATPPVFNSVSIDKKSATTGDKLIVTVDASDDISGIKYISVDYRAPAGNATKSASLRKISENKYSGTLTVGPNDAVGVWKVDFISLTDNALNSMYINNSEINKYGSILKDLSIADFEVTGTIPDITPPVFNNISIDKKTASKGEKVTVTIDASDDISGIKYISVDYKAPAGNATKSASLRKISEGKYSGTLTVGLNDAVGLWKVDFISLTDNASNSIYINNSEINKYGNVLKDLSVGDFEVNSTVLDPIVTPIPTPTPDEPTKEIEMPTSIKITGTERVGNTLVAELLKDDSKFIPTYPGKAVYEWYRLDNEYSKTGSLIGRSKYYYLSSSDLDKYIKVVVYYNNKKINEYITSKITKRESSSNSDSPSGSSSSSSSNDNSSSSSSNSSSSSSSNNSSSSSSNSSSSSSNDSSNSGVDNKASTTNNENVPSTDNKVTNTAKVEKSQDGTIKLVNDAGQAVTGWQQIDGKWYLADSVGVAQTGWQQTNGTWYLLNNDGVMATGWTQVNGDWYLLKDNGSMTTGWQQVNGKWYLLNDSGSMATGWQQTNGKWYYLYSDGSMASNTTIEGYRVDESGAWV